MSKTRKPGSRNPYAASVVTPKYKTRVAKSGKEREKQRDGWDRAAKHKGREIDPTLQLGDTIEYKGQDGIIKTADGPGDLIGITVDGAYKLVAADKLTLKLEESLARMRELSR